MRPFTRQLPPSWRRYHFALIRAEKKRQRRAEFVAAVHRAVAKVATVFANIGAW